MKVTSKGNTEKKKKKFNQKQSKGSFHENKAIKYGISILTMDASFQSI